MNLAEAILKQLKRVREDVLPQYLELRGKPGVNVEFAIATINQTASKAERAAISGDTIEMIKVLKELEDIQ